VPVENACSASLDTLLTGPSPAVLTTYRKDGTALVSPVWFRWHDSAFEVVIAEGDIKLQHLARDPRCALVVFEANPPFRGVEARGVAQLIECDVTPLRVEIAGRYLGANDGARFAAQRVDNPGVLLRIAAESTRVWDLSDVDGKVGCADPTRPAGSRYLISGETAIPTWQPSARKCARAYGWEHRRRVGARILRQAV
jgi:PPOX class probable F420-dependent enzyme